MSFNQVLGQKAAIQILQDELDSGRIHHAYLFTGKSGVGKKTLAVEFAKAVLCLKQKLDACEQCLSCRKIKHSNHPDLRIVGIEDGDSIKIDQIRELQKDIAYKPYEGERKVYIIEKADKLTLEAANSLLKTLEEPPEYGLIILLAEELDRLLPTVISRCQQIQLNTLLADVIEQRIVEKGSDQQTAHIMAKLADGSLGRALKLIEDEDFFANREKIYQLLYKLPELNAVEIFQGTDDLVSFLKNKNDFPLFYLILSWYRDIILYNQGYDKEIVNYDYLDWIRSANKDYSLEELISIVELVNNIKGYIDNNVRKELALQVLFFKIRAKKVR